MAEKIPMLALSPTMSEGHIAKWNVAEGDKVSSGDILLEVETDKATMDYEGTYDGVVLKILKKEGSGAAVGEPIAIIGEEGEDISGLLEEIAADLPVKKAPADKDETTVEADTVEEPEDKPDPAAKAEVEDSAPEREDDKDKVVRSSPLARKIAKQHDLDLGLVKGSGPSGRIVKADVEKAIADGVKPTAVKAPLATVGKTTEDVEIPHSKVRRIVAERLAESKYTAPHYYLKLSVEMDDLMQSRSLLNKTTDQKVSVNAFLIKLIAETLKRHRRVNSTWYDDKIVEHGNIDIGLAVAQPDGLITPVVRNCEQKGIKEIESDLAVLIEKAREGKLQPEEYTGATFTISSLGSYGIEEFTAIINPPGSAILAIGAIKKEPVVRDDDTIEIRQTMKLTLSCDHRTIDGAVGAEFLKDLKDTIESPIRALF